MSRCMATGCHLPARRHSLFCSDGCLEKVDKPQGSSRNQEIDRIRDNIACASTLEDLKDILQYQILPLLED